MPPPPPAAVRHERVDYSHATFAAVAKGRDVTTENFGLRGFERWTIDGHEVTIDEAKAADPRPSAKRAHFVGWRWIEIDETKGSKHVEHQLPLASRKEMRPMWRTKAEIEANLESRKVFN